MVSDRQWFALGMVALVGAVCAVILLTADGGDAPVSGLPTPSAQVSGEGERLCLEPLLRKPGPERRYMLAVAERAIAAGGQEPAPGSCGALRLEWLRGER